MMGPMVSEEERALTEPIRFEFDLAIPAGAAFAAYVDRIGEWWPADFRALQEQGPGTAVIERWVDGRVFETADEGRHHDWGEVREFDELVHVLVHEFHLAQDRDHATEVAVSFVDRDGGSRMRFEHRGWTSRNLRTRPKFTSDDGWPMVLGGYLELVRDLADGTSS